MFNVMCIRAMNSKDGYAVKHFERPSSTRVAVGRLIFGDVQNGVADVHARAYLSSFLYVAFATPNQMTYIARFAPMPAYPRDHGSTIRRWHLRLVVHPRQTRRRGEKACSPEGTTCTGILGGTNIELTCTSNVLTCLYSFNEWRTK